MEINKERYLLYQKRAVLQAYLDTINNRINDIEMNHHYDRNDHDDRLFARRWSALNKEEE